MDNLIPELEAAVKAGDAQHITSLLVEYPALVNATAASGVPLVRLALYYGHPDIAATFVDQGAELGLHDDAALGRTRDVALWLQTTGDVDLNAYSSDGYTPLQLASFFGRVEVARLLLQHGADPNLVSRNAMRIQAIHSAAAGDHVAIVVALLEHGADPNAQQSDGFRPLHAAAQNGSLDLARLLVQFGADPALPTDGGELPRDTALAAGHADLAAYLADLSGLAKR